MLVIEVSQIPPEGMDLLAPLDPGQVHVEGEESFALESGGTLRCTLERGDDRTVHVRGAVQARLRLECGRCLPDEAPEAFAAAVTSFLEAVPSTTRASGRHAVGASRERTGSR